MNHDNLIIQHVLDANDIISFKASHLHERLAAYINNLILKNFEELVYVLYRVDVSEHKLKRVLKENNKADAGSMIATLIIERQIQKIKSRREHRPNDNIIDDEESW